MIGKNMKPKKRKTYKTGYEDGLKWATKMFKHPEIYGLPVSDGTTLQYYGQEEIVVRNNTNQRIHILNVGGTLFIELGTRKETK